MKKLISFVLASTMTISMATAVSAAGNVYKAGDMSGNNIIDTIDISLINNAIIKGNYNPIADVDCNGVLNSNDTTIVKNILAKKANTRYIDAEGLAKNSTKNMIKNMTATCTWEFVDKSGNKCCLSKSGSNWTFENHDPSHRQIIKVIDGKLTYVWYYKSDNAYVELDNRYGLSLSSVPTNNNPGILDGYYLIKHLSKVTDISKVTTYTASGDNVVLCGPSTNGGYLQMTYGYKGVARVWTVTGDRGMASEVSYYFPMG